MNLYDHYERATEKLEPFDHDGQLLRCYVAAPLHRNSLWAVQIGNASYATDLEAGPFETDDEVRQQIRSWYEREKSAGRFARER